MKKWLLSAATLLLSTSAWLQPLTGTYTIDPALPAGGSNYQTFAAFTTDLGTNGVSGPVTVNVKEGTYTEQINLGAITGSSATNTVTIQSDPTNTNDVIVTYANPSTTDGTVKTAGTQWVTIDGLTLQNTGSSTDRFMYIDDGCGNITMSNNKFEGNVHANTTSTSYALVYATTPAAVGTFTFDGNEFLNGSDVVYITGSTSSNTPKLVFTNNTATDYAAYGLYATYVDSLIVTNNTFTQAASSSTHYGIRTGWTTSTPGSYFQIEDNVIGGNTSGTFYGIYANYTNSTVNDSRIVNNMIYNAGSSTGTRYGMYIYSCANIDIFHNSVNIIDGSTTGGRAFYSSASTSSAITYTQGNYDIRNNIFVNTGGGYAAEIATNAQGHIATMNYNVFHGTNATPLRWGTTNHTLATWQVATLHDLNSAAGDPLFAGATDLHVAGTVANDMGDNTVGVANDIDGDVRPASGSTVVDAGADEYTPSSCLPVTDITVFNISYDQVDVTWSVNGLETMWNVEIVPAGTTPTGTGTSYNNDTVTLNMLTGSTDYDVYVQSDCGGAQGNWTGPFTFTTACGPIAAPWFEPFTVTSTPPCWSQSAVQGGPWVFTGNPGYTAAGTLDHTNGSQNNYAWMDFSVPDESVIIQSPLIDVSALNVPELRFWVWSHYDGALNPYNELFVEAFDGTNWNQLTLVQGDFGPQWTEFNVIIPPAYIFGSNLVQVRFRAEPSPASNTFNNDLLLDDVSIIEAPTGPEPIDIVLLDSDTSSAVFSWTSTGSETEWVVEYGPIGFTPGTGTSEMTTTMPDTITGLTPNMFYEFYVRAYCTPGDTSFYHGPIKFNTYGLGSYMEYEINCHPDGFVDISETGAANPLDSDGETGFQLPFPFYFQGDAVTQITVANNGVVIFNDISAQVSAFNSNTIATSAVEGLYPFWDDLQDNGGNVYFEEQGTAPNRRFIVQWEKKHDLNAAGTMYSFQLIMEEASGKVYYQYQNMVVGSTTYDNGNSATIGLAGTNQDFPLSYNNTSFLEENSCVEFYYTSCPKPTDLLLQYITPDEAAFSWTAGLSGEDTWTVVYDTAGFDPATSGTVLTVNPSPVVTLVGLEQLTDYDIYVMAICANGDTSRALFTTFRTLPLCSDPSGLQGSSVTDSLYTNWNWNQFDPNYPATGFDVAYGPTGYSVPNGATIYNGDVNFGDSIYDQNLLAGGVYEIYVQAVCDTLVSNWVGPITVTMPLDNDSVCGAETLPVDGVMYAFSNQGATTQPNENTIAPPVTGAQETDGWLNNNLNFTTWFKFTAPASGKVRIDGSDIGFNGQAAVYEAISCNDFTSFNLIAANDDEIDGVSLAPNFTICGLTPGAEYFLMHDSYSTSQTGTYSLRMTELALDAGTANPTLEICSQETINLFDGISGYQPGGMWVDLDGTFHIEDDSLFNTSGLAYETYNFEYRLEDGCAMDSTVAQYQVYAPSMAGDDGSITICKNEPGSLVSAVGGTFDAGGTWYDFGNNPKNDGNIALGELNIPGNYNFSYIVGNGVCPDDTSIVTVSVLSNCDFWSVDELAKEGISVFPNPTRDYVQVTFESAMNNVAVTVTDANGKVIQTLNKENNSNLVSVDLSGLETGVYFLKIESETFSGVERIIKQ
ncbi:MAG: T9SS type A sorting domain-containing protein [Crocinitomicaceae bacterium]|nr:T9SS type A sorting domain-containing protein [Crocinitomicaceae bacterium]